MKFLTTLFTLSILSIGLSACGNTLKGIGQDIERAGEKIQRAAD